MYYKVNVTYINKNLIQLVYKFVKTGKYKDKDT